MPFKDIEMTIDWLNFTPWLSLAGGLLIGVAVAILLLFNGRIAGISGIVGGLLTPQKNDILWRFAFILGLVVAPFFYSMLVPLPEVTIDAGTFTLIVAGLLVGFGTRVGSGCTSGHGVCGISRQSNRSIIATLIFIMAGFITVFTIKNILG